MFVNIIKRVKLFSNSLKFQIIFINMILIIFLLLFTSIISYYNYNHSLISKTSEYSIKVLSQLDNTINTYLENMVEISAIINDDDDLQSILKTTDLYYLTDNATLRMQEHLSNFLATLNKLHTDIDGIFIFNKDEIIFYKKKDNVIVRPLLSMGKYDYKESDWYNRLINTNGNSIILGPFKQQQFRSPNDEFFSVAKKIVDSKTREEIGVILLNMNLSKIEKICKNITGDSIQDIVILDQFGEVVYSTLDLQPKAKTTLYSKIKNIQQGSFTAVLNGKDHLATFTTSQYSEWKTISIVPNNLLFQDAEFIGRVTIIILAASIFFAIIMIYFISSKITSPLYTLRKKMKLVEEGNLDVSVEVKTKNEIGQLSHSFNKMLSELKELVHKIYEVQLQAKEAQFIALQSQINPHFLYNTLESIHMMAEINQDYEAGYMASSLGKFFRYCIKGGNGTVTIAEEIDHMKNYVAIQQIRYEDNFKVYISIEEGLEKYRIIKLCFQPLVENAINHGLEKKLRDGYIQIYGIKERNLIKFSIFDNGVGISDEKLSSLNQSMNDNDKCTNQKSIGIINVNNRIKTYFGKDYGLKIYSIPDVGTEVDIVIPAIE